MRDLTFLVTGATGGLGALVCEALVARGARVIASCRDRAALELLCARIGGAITPAVADLASLSEVAALADATAPVDVLVNNAGVGFGRDQMKRETSRDGFELRFAVNYLAPYVLTHRMVASEMPPRAVVQVASAGQRALDFADLEFTRGYDGIVAYRRSKLAQVMLAFDLAASHPHVASTALHPGTFLDTPMVRESGITPMGTAARGCEAIVDVIGQTLAGATGVFFDQERPARADAQAYDDAARAALRDATRARVAKFLVSR